MKYIETYKIDVGKNFYNDIKVKQNDTARYIRFEIFQNSIPFDLKGKNVRIYGIKPDKKILWNGCTLEDEANGKILIPVTSQMTAVPGTLKAEITIIEGDDILSSIPFEVKVIPCVRNDKAVESTNEFKDVFSTKITTVEVVDRVLQLTKDKYQIAEVPSGTEIRMPESIKADEYTNINLIINAKENKVLVFDDIKWKEKPNIVAGYDYVISFTCINNIWYGEITEYKEFEKTWLYKNGDECTAVTGGWNNYFRDTHSFWTCVKGVLAESYMEETNARATMCSNSIINKIDFTDYSYIYIEYSTSPTDEWNNYAYARAQLSLQENISGYRNPDKLALNLSTTSGLNSSVVKRVDISSISGSYYLSVVSRCEECNGGNILRVKKIWLE